jgi:hypothetical protein
LVELCSKDNACFYELSSKRRVIQTSSIATRKAGGTMMASKSSGCGCGDSKMQEADLLQVCQCTAKGSMMGYNCYDETKTK